MSTFIDKLKAILKNDSSELSDTELAYNLQAGSNFTYMSIPQHLLSPFATISPGITDGNGYSISGTWHIVGVVRNGKMAEEVDPNLRYFLDYSDSIYYATEYFPKYFIWNSKVYIKPDPTTSYIGNITYVSPPTISTTTDSDSVSYSILSNIIINYAAGLSFTGMANYNLKNSGSQSIYEDALDKAGKLIDDSAGVGGDTLSKSVQGYLTAEDTELAVATVQAAQNEVQRAIAAIQNQSGIDKVYFEKAATYFKMAEEELKGYINANPKWIEFQAQLAQRQGGR